jgi:hypothetical protein
MREVFGKAEVFSAGCECRRTMMGAELLADMTADLDGIMERFRQDLAYVVETLGMRPAARRLGVSPNSLYHWMRDAHEARMSSIRAVLALAEELRSEPA